MSGRLMSSESAAGSLFHLTEGYHEIVFLFGSLIVAVICSVLSGGAAHAQVAAPGSISLTSWNQTQANLRTSPTSRLPNISSHSNSGSYLVFYYNNKVVDVVTKNSPLASIQVQWNQVDLFLTNADVNQIWYAIWQTGLGGAGALVCSWSGPVAILCTIGGAVFGTIIASLIWNWAAWNCGLEFSYFEYIPFIQSASWSASTWQCT